MNFDFDQFWRTMSWEKGEDDGDIMGKVDYSPEQKWIE